MTDLDRAKLWRYLSFSAAPFLTIFAVVLIRREDTLSLVLGILLALAAILALIGPFLVRRGR
jgi:DMSO reductase anchor subunit